MEPGFISAGVATATLMRSIIKDAKAADQESVKALTMYCGAIIIGVDALLNEARKLLVSATADLQDDDAATKPRTQINVYFGVHAVYEPLKIAIVEAENLLN